MKSKIILLGLTAFILSSCGIYSKYKPATEVPEHLYGQEVALSDSSSLATLTWQELFIDPQLQALIEQALEGNTDLQSASWRIEEAKAALTSSKLAYLPSFMLTPQGGVSSFDQSKASWTYTGVATASWEIDIFGKLTNAKRRAQAVYAQSHEYKQAVTSSLIANVANLYYTLLMLDKQYSISQQTAVNWETSIKSMTAMKEAGMSNSAAIAQAQANYLSVKASVLELEQQINELENTLSVLYLL